MNQIGRNIRYLNNYKDEVSFSRKHEFEFMQIWYLKGELIIDSKNIDDIINEDFPVIIHAVLDINEYEEHIPGIINVLKRLSHKELIIHPICESEEINDNSIYKLSDKISYANEMLKNENVKLYVENNCKLTELNHSIRDIEILFSGNEDVELLLDVAHIDSYEHLSDIVNIKYPKMLHVADKHFSVIHEHLPIGEGELDYKFIMSEVLHEFKGKIILEIDQSDNEIVSSYNKILECI